MDVTVFFGALAVGLAADYLADLHRSTAARLVILCCWVLGALVAAVAAAQIHNPRLLLAIGAGVPLLGRAAGQRLLNLYQLRALRRVANDLVQRYG